MSEVPKTYKELLLYALAKAVDARVNIAGALERNLMYLDMYYSAIVALVNIASPHLEKPEELLAKASKAWEGFSLRNPRVYAVAEALDGILREVITQLCSRVLSSE